jgi:predicted TIM-barrel fold metal-dependent hydrolase
MPRCLLVRQEHIPDRARYPVIDAHNHLWGAWDQVDEVVKIMNQVGVAAYADLTANLDLQWADGGYRFQTGDLSRFVEKVQARHPTRFYAFTTATFNRPADEPLFQDAAAFVEETIATLREHARLGALGLKILKELGLRYRDGQGRLIAVDDERLASIWDEAGRLGLPVLIHQADPIGFFEPITPENEHYETLKKYSSWSFADPAFPRFHELLERRDRLVRRHPNTTFLLPHMGSYPENLGYLARLLEENPNVFLDFSARLDELGRQPYSARLFLIRYQNRIVFGSDMKAHPDIYRFYFRFLETRDEWFEYPDYDGAWGRARWGVHGLGLPNGVLRKIYHGNILKLMPGLRDRVRV